MHLDRAFAETLSVKHVARSVGVSVRRLQRDFLLLTGQSIQDYVTRLRLDAAIVLLTTADDKVEWIARSVGWASRKNLNRALALRYGLTPAEVRLQGGIGPDSGRGPQSNH